MSATGAEATPMRWTTWTGMEAMGTLTFGPSVVHAMEPRRSVKLLRQEGG